MTVTLRRNAFEQDVSRKGRDKVPRGEVSDVHRCGVISTEARAARHRHGMLEAFKRPR